MVRQSRIEPARLVFIDETWTKTNMAPLRGWGPRGLRLRAKVPHGRWKTMTFLAALRHDRIDAPWLLDGPINGEKFRLYVEKVLVPALGPRDIVVMDNLGSHKGQVVRQAIRSTGAKLFARPQPDRAGLRQAQALVAQSRRTKLRRRHCRHRTAARQLHAPRMRQLLRQLRLSTGLKPSRSSRRLPCPSRRSAGCRRGRRRQSRACHRHSPSAHSRRAHSAISAPRTAHRPR